MNQSILNVSSHIRKSQPGIKPFKLHHNVASPIKCIWQLFI